MPKIKQKVQHVLKNSCRNLIKTLLSTRRQQQQQKMCTTFQQKNFHIQIVHAKA